MTSEQKKRLALSLIQTWYVCRICQWDLIPEEQTIHSEYICPQCGYEPSFDNEQNYKWDGQWWSSLRPKEGIVDRFLERTDAW